MEWCGVVRGGVGGVGHLRMRSYPLTRFDTGVDRECFGAVSGRSAKGGAGGTEGSRDGFVCACVYVCVCVCVCVRV